MRITKVDLYTISLPLVEPFIISYTSYETMPAIIVKVHTDAGIVGYGESVPDEHVTGESVKSVHAALKYNLIPAILGEDPRNIKRIHTLMNEALVLNGAAKAAIDIACYDVLGKASGLPIYTLLGGRKEEQPMIPKVLSILEPEILATQAKEAIQSGYKEIKMKLGTDPKKDVERVRMVREAVGPYIPIKVDANQGWRTISTARKVMSALEPYQLSWVEQPLPRGDHSFFKRLQESTSIPLMADESLVHEQDLRTFLLDGSVDYINIKLMKSGGIYPAHKLATQAELFGISCQIGSMVESSIGSAAGFHVAVSKQNIIATEISGPTRFSTDTGNLSYNLPYVQLPHAPGLGIEVNDRSIERMSTLVKRIS